MFNDFFSIVIRDSGAVDYIAANPFTGVVRVLFKSGHSYQYNNVSRRAIVNLINQPNMSLGFWINNNCVDNERAQVAHRYTYAV